MYSSLPHLQTAIRQSLQKGALCRIYPESLTACWPHVSPQERANRVERFAAQNHWQVAFRELGNLGLVAEFTKAEGFERAA
jgi:hypothetical protein